MANVKVLTPEGRLRWVNVFEAKMNYAGTALEKSVTLLIPKKSSLAPLEKAWMEAARAEFGGKVPGSLRKIAGGAKPIVRDGDEYYDTKDDDKKPMYEEYRGCWFITPSCKETQPLRILDQRGVDIMDPADLYDGAYGQAVIELSTYTAKSRPGFPGGPMCSVTLFGLKKTRDGEPIEGASSATPLTDAELDALFGTVSSSTDDL
jgi:hypothetical protein